MKLETQRINIAWDTMEKKISELVENTEEILFFVHFFLQTENNLLCNILCLQCNMYNYI